MSTSVVFPFVCRLQNTIKTSKYPILLPIEVIETTGASVMCLLCVRPCKGFYVADGQSLDVFTFNNVTTRLGPGDRHLLHVKGGAHVTGKVC